MGRKFLVIETFFGERKQNHYYLMLPKVRDKGFYRSVMSFNAFFNSTRRPKANVTEVRQFTADNHIDIQMEFNKNVDWDNLQTFESIWDFYKFIGYDYKTRKYASQETQKVFNGRHFVIPKKKTPS